LELVTTVPTKEPEMINLGHDRTNVLVGIRITKLFVTAMDTVYVKEYDRIGSGRPLVPALIDSRTGEDRELRICVGGLQRHFQLLDASLQRRNLRVRG